MLGILKKRFFFLFIGAFVFASLAGAPRVFAYSQVNAVFNSSGVIDTTSLPTSGCQDGIFSGARLYFGVYPDFSSLQETLGFGPTQDNCQTLFASFSGNLESWQNSGDGDYFMVFGINGDTPPLTGNYVFSATRSGGLWQSGPPVFDTSTRFITFTPTLGTTTPVATSTAFTFGVTGYINENDLSSSTELYIRWRQQSGGGIRGNSLIQDYGEFLFPITSSGDFSFSTTTSVLNTGVYISYYAIRDPLFEIFGVGFFNETILDSVGNFVVGEASQSEIINSEILLQTTGGGLVDTTIPTEETASSSLYALGSIFNLKDQVFTRFPINWVFEYVQVLNALPESTSTTTIPAVTINYGNLALLQNVPTTTPINTTFTFFSASTFDDVAEFSGIQAMRTFLSWTLWLALVFYAWRAVSGMFIRKS